jgi:predicted nucleotidyltransferase
MSFAYLPEHADFALFALNLAEREATHLAYTRSTPFKPRKRLINPPMRLHEAERQAILQSIRSADPDATVYLFGSRVDDSEKGGDIDLLVLSKKINLMTKLTILAQLHQQLGAQKIDLAVYQDLSRPFARLAVSEGLPL